jgi:hypothetical protein
MLLVERGAALAHTRNGHNWSDRYRFPPRNSRKCE